MMGTSNLQFGLMTLGMLLINFGLIAAGLNIFSASVISSGFFMMVVGAAMLAGDD